MSNRISMSRNEYYHASQFANYKLQTLMEFGVTIRLRGSTLELGRLQRKLHSLKLPLKTFLERVDFVNNLYAALCAHGIEIVEINLAPSNNRGSRKPLDENLTSKIESLPSKIKARTKKLLELGAIKVRAIESIGHKDLFGEVDPAEMPQPPSPPTPTKEILEFFASSENPDPNVEHVETKTQEAPRRTLEQLVFPLLLED